jgi:hypothetical protein
MSQSSAPLITPVAQAPIAKARVLDGVIIGIVAFFALSFLIATGIDKLLTLFDASFGGHLATHYARWLKSAAWVISGGQAWSDSVTRYWAWAHRVHSSAGFAIIYFTALISMLSALVGAIWLGWKVAEPKDPNLHIRGRQIWRESEASTRASAASREKCAISKPEIQIHNDIVLARHQVMQSIMVMGAQGGGKTQILWRILLPLIQRNWKTVIFDLTKGDYTISTPGVHRLFALNDTRSSVWAIWKDVKTLADAESFARGLIPESSDPMWSNAARGVVIAMLMRLITEKGQNWRWKDLGETTFATLEEVRDFAARYYPPALAAVDDAESKTTQSIRINYMSYLAPLYRCCEEWKDLSENFTSEWTRERFPDEREGDEKQDERNNGKPRAFSWVDWLNDDNSDDRTIVLQSNAKDKSSAVALIRAMMEVQVSHIASLEFSESKTRSIFYMLDELPQLGRLECLPTIMEVGRSKGCAVGLAFQDIAQIRQIYPKGEDDKWLAMLGIRIFAQVKGGASAKFVLDQIGMREVARPTNSVTRTGSGYTISSSWQHAETAVMTADELEQLGPKKSGVKAIVLGHSTDVLELTWPYYATPERRKAKIARPAVIPNTPTQVNGSEGKIEAASLENVNHFKNGSESINKHLESSFEPIKKHLESTNLEITEISETRVNTESAKEIVEVPEAFVTIENAEIESEIEQESAEETAVNEAMHHITSELVAEAAGIEPEAVEIGLALLDEIGGGSAQGETETVKVMTPAQIRKIRKQEKESTK